MCMHMVLCVPCKHTAHSLPIHTHVAPYYIERGVIETSVPNVVTAVLASYRGFDTLGEVFVVFTAGIGVLMLLSRERLTRRQRNSGSDLP